MKVVIPASVAKLAVEAKPAEITSAVNLNLDIFANTYTQIKMNDVAAKIKEISNAVKTNVTNLRKAIMNNKEVKIEDMTVQFKTTTMPNKTSNREASSKSPLKSCYFEVTVVLSTTKSADEVTKQLSKINIAKLQKPIKAVNKLMLPKPGTKTNMKRVNGFVAKFNLFITLD
jgi:hypothetical protein